MSALDPEYHPFTEMTIVQLLPDDMTFFVYRTEHLANFYTSYTIYIDAIRHDADNSLSMDTDMGWPLILREPRQGRGEVV